MAYFSPSLPVIIDEPGMYATRDGEMVEIFGIVKSSTFGCLGHYPNGLGDSWHKSGRLNFFDVESRNDIVRKVDDGPQD